MYDAGKIIPGLLIFLLLITFPVWYNAAMGKAQYRPDPVILTADDPGRDSCVLPAGRMATEHMDLLNNWRERVVREGERYETTFDGRDIEMSLNRACMDCHSNKTGFCDQCHTYLSVDPYCWECHVEPAEVPALELEGGEL